MPTIVLGIILTAAAVITGEYWILLSSFVMIIGGGDFTIILKILMDHPKEQVLYHDHPTELGVLVFEK